MKVGPIEKNIPVWRHGLKYPIGEMEIGDSFFVEAENGETIRDVQKRIVPTILKHAQRLGIKTTIRTMKDQNGLRVWRVEKEKS